MAGQGQERANYEDGYTPPHKRLATIIKNNTLLSETESGRPTVDWGRLALLSLGGWLLAVATNVATLLAGLAKALFMLTGGLQSWYNAFLGTVVGVAEMILQAGFGGALAWLTSFGTLAGPLGIGIALLALYLWVTLE